MNSVAKIGFAIEWQLPVWVRSGKDGRALIPGPAAALRFLQQNAEHQSGRMHKLAVENCRAALQRKGDIELARAYFVAACDEQWIMGNR